MNFNDQKKFVSKHTKKLFYRKIKVLQFLELKLLRFIELINLFFNIGIRKKRVIGYPLLKLKKTRGNRKFILCITIYIIYNYINYIMYKLHKFILYITIHVFNNLLHENDQKE